jgi:hypothetical protein
MAVAIVIYIEYSVMWWCPSKVLAISLSVYLGGLTFIEATDFLASPGNYLTIFENYLDLALFSIVYTILYVPNSWMEDSSKYSIDLYNCAENDTLEPDPYSIRRSLSAIAIVLAVFRYVTLRNQFASTPMKLTEGSRMYRIMFSKVLVSFYEVVKSYSFQLMSFGLGFYILLHKDTKGQHDDIQRRKEKGKDFCGDEAPYPFFDHPWLALLKTSTMFVGEIDFPDIPLGGGNVSVVLGYVYYFVFLFVVVLVIMNLLNALAVSDISQIRKESELECMLFNIDEINGSANKLLLNPFTVVSLIFIYYLGLLFFGSYTSLWLMISFSPFTVVLMVLVYYLCIVILLAITACCWSCLLVDSLVNPTDSKYVNSESKTQHFDRNTTQPRVSINLINARTGMLTLRNRYSFSSVLSLNYTSDLPP